MSLSLIGARFCGHKAEDSSPFRCLYLPIFVFSVLAFITLAFALYTDHRWEDWYITYRASKNVALGNGLVFTAGERVHSFTSPIGTVIPALLAVLTSANDELVIWLYRILSAVMLGFCGVQLLRIAQFFQFSRLATAFLIGLLATNLLMIDFSINGMETAFMLFGLIYFARLLLTRPDRLVLKLGLAMAYLMYTRPDAFVYAGALVAGFFVFEPTLNGAIANRRAFALHFAKALLIAVALYAPWVLWTWSYYGSPIPHTIVAKAGLRNYDSNKLVELFKYPFAMFSFNAIGGIFVPPYPHFSWQSEFRVASELSAFVCVFVLLWPRVPAVLRAMALAVLLVAFYLDVISGQGGMPWYLPNLGILFFMLLGFLYHEVVRSALSPALKRIAAGMVVGVLFCGVLNYAVGAYSLKQQQQIIEFGNRKQIGLWLKEYAKSPHDTVFLECLGYIGFYSNLKMLDYPGMSSPESVAAIKRLKATLKPGESVFNFAALIADMKPDWVVLRPYEEDQVRAMNPALLGEAYVERKVFDVREQIPQSLPGRGYLMFDSRFTVYERRR